MIQLVDCRPGRNLSESRKLVHFIIDVKPMSVRERLAVASFSRVFFMERSFKKKKINCDWKAYKMPYQLSKETACYFTAISQLQGMNPRSATFKRKASNVIFRLKLSVRSNPYLDTNVIQSIVAFTLSLIITLSLQVIGRHVVDRYYWIWDPEISRVCTGLLFSLSHCNQSIK